MPEGAYVATPVSGDGYRTVEGFAKKLQQALDESPGEVVAVVPYAASNWAGVVVIACAAPQNHQERDA